MTADEIESVFSKAAENAIIYGCGFIKMVHTPTGSLIVDVIEPEEYKILSEALAWASENTKIGRAHV